MGLTNIKPSYKMLTCIQGNPEIKPLLGPDHTSLFSFYLDLLVPPLDHSHEQSLSIVYHHRHSSSNLSRDKSNLSLSVIVFDFLL